MIKLLSKVVPVPVFKTDHICFIILNEEKSQTFIVRFAIRHFFLFYWNKKYCLWALGGSVSRLCASCADAVVLDAVVLVLIFSLMKTVYMLKG